MRWRGKTQMSVQRTVEMEQETDIREQKKLVLTGF